MSARVTPFLTTLTRAGVAWVGLLVVLSLVFMPMTAHAQVGQPNDGGSGRDAGAGFGTAVPVGLGKMYAASFTSHDQVGGDPSTDLADEDWFTFSARAGQRINAMVDSATAPACVMVVAPDRTVIHDAECADWSSTINPNAVTATIRDVVAPADGTYAVTVAYEYAADQAYEFVVTLDRPASAIVDMGTPSGPSSTGLGQVVVAVADTGVNPYHEMYYRPGNTAHPCTWVVGFDDCSIPALDLSIGEYESIDQALEADRAVWESVKEHQWYWIPRTNIIGAVCERRAEEEPLLEEPAGACIFDEIGHGTQTTSSVLSEAPDALLLVHEGGPGAVDLRTAPVVPDIQSHSWGAYAPLPLHLATLVTNDVNGQKIVGKPTFDPETILFNAAGNIAPFPAMVDAEKVDPDIQIVGGGYPGFWTPSSWTTFDFASWYCRVTADPFSIREYTDACGTSFSAPTAAGTAAAALREIRRREGTNMRSTPTMVSKTVSRDQFLQALRAGASYNPEPGRFPNRPEPGDQPLVEGAEHLSWGYGWLDRTRTNAVVACALNDVCPAKSAAAQQYNEARQQARAAQPHPQ
jgi:hypothetical protein